MTGCDEVVIFAIVKLLKCAYLKFRANSPIVEIVFDSVPQAVKIDISIYASRSATAQLVPLINSWAIFHVRISYKRLYSINLIHKWTILL